MAVRLASLIAGFVTACLAFPCCGRTPGVPFHGDGAADGGHPSSGGAGEAGAASGGAGGNHGATGLGGASGGDGCSGRDGLPACVYIDSCHQPGSWYWECARTADCAFTFPQALPSAPFGISVECVQLSPWPDADAGSSWRLSDDRKTLLLAGSACDLVRASSTPRVFVQSIHSCVL
jgi:hypothetical protein